MNLKLEALMALVASLITLVHLWVDDPYAMGAYVFVAQPLYLVAALFYLTHVVRRLRAGDVS
ncbi:MAG: hypothetical protein AAGB93_07855 [Planctomycetota bacterium]